LYTVTAVNIKNTWQVIELLVSEIRKPRTRANA